MTPIIVVTDEPEKYGSNIDLAPDVTIRHRGELDAVQRKLHEVEGTSAMIYVQRPAHRKDVVAENAMNTQTRKNAQ